MWFKDSRYWKRLMLFGLLPGILPVIILGIFFYFKSSEIVQAKVNDLNMQLLHQTQMRVEEVLNNINSYYLVLANTYDIRYADLSLDFDRYDEIIELQRKLVDFQHINFWIRSAYLVNCKEDWIVGNDGIGKFSAMENKEQLLQLIAKPQYVSWNYLENPANTLIHMNVGKECPMDHIFLLIRLPLNSSSPSGAIIVNLEAGTLTQMLLETRDTGKTMILDKQNRILASADPELRGLKGAALPYVNEIEKQEGLFGFLETDSVGEKVGISFRRSRYNGWTYLTVYRKSQITADSRAIGLACILLCLIMTGLITGVSLLGSTIMYNPVRQVYEIVNKSVRDANPEGRHDEFAYIGKGINALVNSYSTMEEQLKNQQLQLEEFFLHRLVDGELNEKESRSKMKALGRKAQWRSMYIATLQLVTEQGSGSGNDRQDLFMVNFRTLLHETIPPPHRLQTILKKPGLVMLIGSEQEDPPELKRLMTHYVDLLQQKVIKQMNLNLRIGMSCVFHRLSDAYPAYRESLEALISQIGEENRTIVFFAEAHPEEKLANPYPQQLENELTEAVYYGFTTHAEQALSMILVEIFNRQRSVDDRLLSLLRLMISLTKLLQDAWERVDCLAERGIGVLHEELYQLKNTSEAQAWFNDRIIRPVMKALEKRRADQSKAVLDQVLQMIDEEYDTDLSLDSCAQRLNYHSSYIYRLLRKELNTTFSGYLAAYRLKIAKQWLRDTEMTVAEIAERLKYNNSQNFIRFFKKQEKVTPGQYREMYKEL